MRVPVIANADPTRKTPCRLFAWCEHFGANDDSCCSDGCGETEEVVANGCWERLGIARESCNLKRFPRLDLRTWGYVAAVTYTTAHFPEDIEEAIQNDEERK